MGGNRDLGWKTGLKWKDGNLGWGKWRFGWEYEDLGEKRRILGISMPSRCMRLLLKAPRGGKRRIWG